jgi:hypothetical protein
MKNEISMSKDEFKDGILSKGWSLSNLAWRWGITAEYLSRLITNQNRGRHWDDAVRGLPTIGRIKAATIRKERFAASPKDIGLTPSVAATANDSHGYSYQGYLTKGSVVVASKAIRDFAESGEEGYVSAVRDGGCGEEYLIVFHGDEKWFREIDVETSLVETGREIAC